MGELPKADRDTERTTAVWLDGFDLGGGVNSVHFWMVNKQNSLPGSPSDYLYNSNYSNWDKLHQSANGPSAITGAPVSRLEAHTATGLHPVKPHYAVEFDTSRGAGKVWINIVDKATGKVVFKIPPELVRQWTNQSQIPKGANVDLKS